MKIHMAKKGDSLYELSKKYGVSLEKLIEANPQLLNPEQLNVGDKVKIPTEATPVPAPEQIIHKHVVKQGDSLWKLSKAWGVSLKEMIDANPQLKNPNALLTGETVNIPKSGMPGQPQHHNSNENHMMDKTMPGSKTHTGPKENMTAPKPTQPVIPQLPQLPEMPVHHPEKVSTQPKPNQPIPMPAPAPVYEMPVPTPAPAPELKPEPVHEMPMPIVPVQPVPTCECPVVEHVEMAQHLYIQFPVPAKEVMYEKPVVEMNPMPCGDMIPQTMEKTSYYPGLTDNCSYTQPTEYTCPPFYEQPNFGQQNWAHHAQIDQLCCPEVSPMNYAAQDCYVPYTMPSFMPESVGGGNPQHVNWAPNSLPMATEMAPVTVNYAPYYSCTPPYEWTYPQPEMHGAYQTVPTTPYGAYGSGYPMPEYTPPKDCGCRQPDELLQTEALQTEALQTEALASDTAKETVENSNDLLSTREVVKSEETATVKKVKIKSAKKTDEVPRKKEVKSKNPQRRRYNPWINA